VEFPILKTNRCNIFFFGMETSGGLSKEAKNMYNTPSKIIRRDQWGGDSTNLSADRSGVSNSSSESSLYH
jgi:hypothetical protein